MSAPSPPITLTTDFGQKDHYLAQMKGVILGLSPLSPIVDVTHEIPRQDVRRAAFLIAELADAFPPGTIHVAVVDPGVGSERKILAAHAEDQFYIAPDNGLLSLVLKRAHIDAVVSIESEHYRRPSVTATFHGRDIMAPAAGHLARGVPIDALGPRWEGCGTELVNAEPTIFRKKIVASVAWIDHFGNIVTNVSAGLLRDWDPRQIRVTIGDHCIRHLRRYYAEVAVGEAVLITGSSGQLEIAVNGGNAAERFGVHPGDPLTVEDASR